MHVYKILREKNVNKYEYVTSEDLNGLVRLIFNLAERIPIGLNIVQINFILVEIYLVVFHNICF